MPSTRSFGFTLIELMVVIAVFAIMAALALPSFKSILEGRRLVAAADNLHVMLQYARSEAIKQNQDIQFQFDTAAWCYGVDDNGADCDCTNPSSCTVDGVQKVVTSGSFTNVTLSSNGFAGSSVIFTPRQGMPDDSGSFTFTISGRTKSVGLNPVGRIRVE